MRRLLHLHRTGHIRATAEIHRRGRRFHIAQRRKHRPIKRPQPIVSGDKTVSMILLDGGADEDAVDIDNRRMTHAILALPGSALLNTSGGNVGFRQGTQRQDRNTFAANTWEEPLGKSLREIYSSQPIVSTKYHLNPVSKQSCTIKSGMLQCGI